MGAMVKASFSKLKASRALSVNWNGIPLRVEAGERDNDIGVVESEASVEVGKAKEGLNVPNFLQLGPIVYGLNLHLVHGESLGRENISEVFDLFHMKFALVSAGE